MKAEKHLISSEVDLIDLSEDLEGRPGQTGELVARKQQDLERRQTFIQHLVNIKSHLFICTLKNDS